ncbi:MAG: helix-turn-helix transcriptional regulator [Candidatus Woesearchaeota archaeon]|nr:MAG: helix-turn-helix transcriptional regulator [Candidatus Woesearchaeota archaeon]
MRITRITLIRTERPRERNINELLQWFGGSIGLFNQRDKDKSCFRIFITLLRHRKKSRDGLTSDEIAYATGLTRGTIIHHLNKLLESRLVETQNSRYFLKVRTLKLLVKSLQQETEQALKDLSSIADIIDEQLGLEE